MSIGLLALACVPETLPPTSGSPVAGNRCDTDELIPANPPAEAVLGRLPGRSLFLTEGRFAVGGDSAVVSVSPPAPPLSYRSARLLPDGSRIDALLWDAHRQAVTFWTYAVASGERTARETTDLLLDLDADRPLAFAPSAPRVAVQPNSQSAASVLMIIAADRAPVRVAIPGEVILDFAWRDNDELTFATAATPTFPQPRARLWHWTADGGITDDGLIPLAAPTLSWSHDRRELAFIGVDSTGGADLSLRSDGVVTHVAIDGDIGSHPCGVRTGRTFLALTWSAADDRIALAGRTREGAFFVAVRTLTSAKTWIVGVPAACYVSRTSWGGAALFAILTGPTCGRVVDEGRLIVLAGETGALTGEFAIPKKADLAPSGAGKAAVVSRDNSAEFIDLSTGKRLRSDVGQLIGWCCWE